MSQKGNTAVSQTTSIQNPGQEQQTSQSGSTGSSDAKTDAGVKFCSSCGAQNPSDASFCENCGNKLS
jgi:predicted amidophosphoribosyltransferase